ncbi:MAG: T9SS type A sorting domain-containing protein [Bacteroidia bacterium]|nr:T9SS type A sorting domain-containing protein [Bacteroidia bacterium]MCZ2249357.1 T9SS type A sorting domain-containing protein [Bacteroidia bacterium]
MKKLLLLVGVVTASLAVNAQTTILNEDFEGANLPTGWTITTAATDGGWKMGTNTDLQSSSFPIPAHTRMIGTNDDGCNCDKSNDVLESPVLDLSSVTTAALSVDILYGEGTYNGASETFSISVSTDSGATYSQLAVIDGAADWRTELFSLNSYAGNSNVRIKFVYSDGGGWLWGAMIDNFHVYSPAEYDLSVTSLNFPSFISNNQPFTVSGTITNYGGQTVNSFTLNYSVDNGAPVSQTITGLNIAAINGTYNFSHPTTYTPTSTGTKSIEVWATDINLSNADQVPSNDSNTGSLMVASQVVDRVVLVEEFTSSTCVPCASFNQTFDPLLGDNHTNELGANFSNVSAVKYQMNWPSPGNDPSYNNDGSTRRSYYGVNGIPAPFIEGRDMIDPQPDIDAAKLVPSAMAISATATAGVGTKKVDVSVTVTPYIDIPSNAKLFIAVLEKEYNYPGATTTQKNYHHAMRKMLPNGNGIALNGLVDGTPVTKNESYTFSNVGAIPAQLSYDLWTGMDNLEVVAFVQNIATKEIYQSSVAPITVLGVNSISNSGVSVKVFPNPVKDLMVLNINADKNTNASVEIVNTIGQVVYTESISAIAGNNTYNINASNLNAGIYFAKVRLGENTQTVKFSVVK